MTKFLTTTALVLSLALPAMAQDYTPDPAAKAGGSINAAYLGNASLTIGSGVTLAGYTTIQDYNTATIINNGVIDANVAGQSMTIVPTTFANNAGGVLRATGGGILSVRNMTTGNNGVIEIRFPL
jgi:hypothetical protein